MALGAELADELQKIFARTKPDGSYHYSNLDARDALVSLLLTGDIDVDAAPASLQKMLTDFLLGLELEVAPTAEQVASATKAYFVAHPMNPELARELNRFARETTMKGVNALDGAAKAARLLGEQQALTSRTTESKPKLTSFLSARAAADKKKY